MGSIVVGAKYLGNLPGLGPYYHTYILYKNDAGQSTYYHAFPDGKPGPSTLPGNASGSGGGGAGNLVGLIDPGTNNSDFDFDGTHPTSAPIITGSDADLGSILDLMTQKMNDINSRQIGYDAIHQNSNTYVQDLLRAAGLDRTIPIDSEGKPIWAPGSADHLLEYHPTGNYYTDILADYLIHIAINIGYGIEQIEDYLLDYLRGKIDQVDSALKRFLPQLFRRDPLVIDLNGDGVKLTSVDQSNAFFDLDGDGFAEKTGWISSQDGFLVIDGNQNGVIDDISELFGSELEDGFTSLSRLDTNADGLISASDALFDELQIWQDVNSNGVTDPGELKSLSDANVSQINLKSTITSTDDAGNLIIRQGESYRADGSALSTIAVAFKVDQVNTRFILPDGFVLNPEVFDLPNIKGFGRVPDLWVAMSLNANLRSRVRDLVERGAYLTDFSDIVGHAFSAQQSVAAYGAFFEGAVPSIPSYLAGDFDRMLEEWAGTVDVPDSDIYNPALVATWSNSTSSGGGVSIGLSEGLMLVSRVVGGFLNQHISDFAFGNDGYYREFERFSSEMALRFYSQVQHAAEQQLAMNVVQGVTHLTDAGISPSSAQIADVIQSSLLQRIENPTMSRFVSALAEINLNQGGARIIGDIPLVLSLLAESFSFSTSTVKDDYKKWYLDNRGLFNALQLSDREILSSLRVSTSSNFLPFMISEYIEHTGGDGNDVLTGVNQADNELFVATSGSDLLEGRGGSDTYLFRTAFGNTAITDDGGSGDEIAFTNGVLLSDAVIRFSNNGRDIVFDFGNMGLLSINDYLNAEGDASIEEISFSDGTSFDPRMLRDLYLRSLATVSADVLDGWERSSTLDGLGGDDILTGRSGDDVLIGGIGSDRLSGNGGNDTYIFARGDGADYIQERSSSGSYGGNDTLRFEAGINPGDVTVTQANNGRDFVLTIANGGGSVGIYETITDGNSRVEQVTFADGTVWDFATLMAKSMTPTGGNDTIYGDDNAQAINGGAGNDRIIARGGNDVIIGGLGNDTLSGDGGDDTYVFARGDGADYIQEWSRTNGYGGNDTLRFEAGINPGDVTVTQANNGRDFMLTIANGGGSVGIYETITDGNSRVEQVTFADGTVWDFATLMAKSMTPTAGNDTIYGTDETEALDGGAGDDRIIARGGNDVIIGGLGNDTLSGDGGDDTYVFARGDGADYIQEWSRTNGYGGNDTLRFEAGINPGDVTVTQANNGRDFMLTIANGGGSVGIYETITDGNSRVEQVTFADGTVWDFATLMLKSSGATSGNDTIYGTDGTESLDGGAGNDRIIARGGNDVIIGGLGNDTLSGDGGDDTYVFARGDGADYIQEWSRTNGYGGNDTLRFEAGINPGDVTVTQANNGRDFMLTIANGGGSVGIYETITDGNSRVEQVTFADGTVWDFATLMAKSMTPTGGNDTIYGDDNPQTLNGGAGDDRIIARGGNDVITGGLGNDTLSGDGGDDTYVFARGDGADYIQEWSRTNGYGGNDTLRFEAGINPGDVTVTQANNGRDFVLTIANGGGSVGIYETITDGNSRVEQVTFADGTVWDFATLMAKSMTPTGGNDTIYGDDNAQAINGGAGNDRIIARGGNDVIIGGLGNDTLSGDGGDDTYVFARGDGADYIQEWSRTNGYGGNDTLRFEAGINPGDVTVTQANNGRDFMLTIANGGGSVGIYETITDGNSRVEQVTFADGTVWDFATLMAKSMTGTSGNDTIYGDDNPQTLNGGAGDDRIIARGGNDVITGGLGNDTLSGDGGDDTYVFARGDGADYIQEWSRTNGYGGNDTLRFEAGINPGDVTVTQANNGRDFVLTIANGGGSVGIYETITDGNSRVEQVTFADGTVWDFATLMAKSMTPTGGNDTIYGDDNAQAINGGAGNDRIIARGGNDVITGGLGNDTLSGDGGDDTYVFARGDGADYIQEWSRTNGYGGNDTLRFEAGINPGDVTVTQANNGRDFMLTIANGGGSVGIYETITDGNSRVEQVTFADGTVWSHNKLMLYSSATDGADTLNGTADADWLNGRGGNDVITGMGGADHLFGETGNDTLSGGDGADTAYFRGSLSDYQLSTVDGVLTVTDLNATLDGNDGTDSLTGVENIQFKDASVALAAPIVLDLDGNGIDLVDQSQSAARFDMDGDSNRDVTSWIGRGDGMLSLDRNGDGTISGVDEISFIGDKAGATSDLDGLSAFDSNGDSLLSNADDRFADFLVWRDTNGNGTADQGELSSLADTGIVAIGLAGTPVSGNWNWTGGTIFNTGSFNFQDGSSKKFADVALSYRPNNQAATESAAAQLVEASAAFRPRGIGLIDDPRNGMARAPVCELFGNEERAAIVAK